MSKSIPEQIAELRASVGREKFVLICKTWLGLIQESYEDMRTCAMMGAIQKNLPSFFQWLQEQPSFDTVKDVKLHEFITSMRLISPLGETTLKDIIKGIESNAKKVPEDPNNNSNL